MWHAQRLFFEVRQREKNTHTFHINHIAHRGKFCMRFFSGQKHTLTHEHIITFAWNLFMEIEYSSFFLLFVNFAWCLAGLVFYFSIILLLNSHDPQICESWLNLHELQTSLIKWITNERYNKRNRKCVMQSN